jgi:hypothetical protein
MKQPFATYVFKPLSLIVAISFLVGMTVAVIAGSSSPQAYLMLGRSDFTVRNIGFGDDLDNLGLGIIEGVRYSAPLHLPQGAKVSQITTYYTATSPISFTTYISVEGQRLDTFNPIAVSVIASISPTGNQTHTAQSVNSPAIDNSQYAYQVSIRTNRPTPPTPVPCPPGMICGYSAQAINLYLIYQIRVDYSFDSFLPSITR